MRGESPNKSGPCSTMRQQTGCLSARSVQCPLYPQKQTGGVHCARSLMWSVDFGEIESLQHLGDWDKLTEQMIDAAIRLERGGADFVLMCTNTMHRMAGAVSEATNVPLLHIADPTGGEN